MSVPCMAAGCVNGVVRVWDVGDKTDDICKRCKGTGLSAPRSIRQWDEVLDLGGQGDPTDRRVPLRRLHLEGINPNTVRHAFRELDSATGALALAGYFTFTWVKVEGEGGPLVNLVELRESYLWEEGRRRMLASRGMRGREDGAPHAWWVSAAWDGVVMHAFSSSSVRFKHPVWREGVQFYVGIDEVEGASEHKVKQEAEPWRGHECGGKIRAYPAVLCSLCDGRAESFRLDERLSDLLATIERMRGS